MIQPSVNDEIGRLSREIRTLQENYVLAIKRDEVFGIKKQIREDIKSLQNRLDDLQQYGRPVKQLL